MKNNIISGLSESRILLSEGAEDFDPSSLTEESPTQSQITNTAIPIAILSLNLSNKTPMFVGGYFQSVTAENEELSIEMVGLLPVGLELVRLSVNKPGLTFNHLEVQMESGPVKIDKQNHYKVKSVSLTNPQSNNRVSIKVVLTERHI